MMMYALDGWILVFIDIDISYMDFFLDLHLTELKEQKIK